VTVTGALAQLRTTDLEASIAFWTEAAGLPLAFRFDDFYAGIAAGEQVFHLELVDAPDPGIAEVAAGDHFHLYLTTTDLDAFAARLAAQGVALTQSPHDTPWGTRECVFRDDQGHTIRAAGPPSAGA
jgi:catechol 2,3-dioxygenase-like lactoylglutathione lyase family enzyme